MAIATVPAAEVAARQQAGPIALIDVRTAKEFAAVHAVGARNVPLDVFAPAGLDRAIPIYLICHSGVRATQAAERCLAAGLTDVTVVAGGTKAWDEAGLPVERGAAAFGVERQVRLIIGAGVLAGCLLGLYVDARWIWLAAFFGGGLVFAGLTGACALAGLVARAPWNRSGGGCCTGSC